MATPSAIYEELQGLSKQRKQSELKLRQLDQQRRPTGPQGQYGNAPGTGANAAGRMHDDGPPREGPPREGRWKHDGGRSEVRGSWQTRGDRAQGGRLEGRLSVPSSLPTMRPRSQLQSAVSTPGGGAVGRGEEGDADTGGAGRKRRGEELDDGDSRPARGVEERPAKVMRGGRDGEDRRERPQRPAWRDGVDTARLPRSSNRISSAVAVGHGEQEDAPKTRAQEAGNEQVKKRNRKMFGALLGHLQKAKKEEEVTQATPVMQKRAELDVKAETKAAESSVVLREKVKRERIEERRRNLETLRTVRQRQQAALHTLAVVRAETQCKALSNFIRTMAEPHIFWMPKKREVVEAAVKKTSDMLGGELLLLKDRLHKERDEDVAEEARRQREIEERIAAAREMAAERERRMAEGEGGGDKEGDNGVDHEANELQRAVEDEEEEPEEEEDGDGDVLQALAM